MRLLTVLISAGALLSAACGTEVPEVPDERAGLVLGTPRASGHRSLPELPRFGRGQGQVGAGSGSRIRAACGSAIDSGPRDGAGGTRRSRPLLPVVEVAARHRGGEGHAPDLDRLEEAASNRSSTFTDAGSKVERNLEGFEFGIWNAGIRNAIARSPGLRFFRAAGSNSEIRNPNSEFRICVHLACDDWQTSSRCPLRDPGVPACV